jgi:hypothetical protein
MALAAVSYLKALLGRVLNEERAQDTFEYVLVLGTVVVLVIAAVATPIGDTIIDGVVAGTCTAIDGLPSIAVTCA